MDAGTCGCKEMHEDTGQLSSVHNVGWLTDFNCVQLLQPIAIAGPGQAVPAAEPSGLASDNLSSDLVNVYCCRVITLKHVDCIIFKLFQ